jgi:hypothetical protein
LIKHNLYIAIYVLTQIGDDQPGIGDQSRAQRQGDFIIIILSIEQIFNHGLFACATQHAILWTSQLFCFACCFFFLAREQPFFHWQNFAKK